MIRLASSSDLDAVAAIYEEILAAEDLRATSYTNWQRGKYPTRRHAQAALEAGSLYIAEENGDRYACFILNREQLPEYDSIPWTIPAAPEKVSVIHTLCVSPRTGKVLRRRGAANRCTRYPPGYLCRKYTGKCHVPPLRLSIGRQGSLPFPRFSLGRIELLRKVFIGKIRDTWLRQIASHVSLFFILMNFAPDFSAWQHAAPPELPDARTPAGKR